MLCMMLQGDMCQGTLECMQKRKLYRQVFDACGISTACAHLETGGRHSYRLNLFAHTVQAPTGRGRGAPSA